MNEKKALLCVSYGTAHAGAAERTIKRIENDLREAFPERELYSAWTSSFVRDKIKKESGVIVDSVEDAVARMLDDGVRDLLVQPTHVIAGAELKKAFACIRGARDKFGCVMFGRPLMSDEPDIRDTAAALMSLFGDGGADTLTVFMGHGSADLQMPVYDMLGECFREAGHPEMRTGTLECGEGTEKIVSSIKGRRLRSIRLVPLLVVAGAHAVRDMAGDSPDSWKNRLLGCAGEVECVLKGMGEFKEIRELYVRHASEAAADGGAK